MSTTKPSQFQLHPITDSDFPALTTALWESFENPRQGLLRLFMPILNNDREASLQACITAQREEYHHHQPHCTWIKIVDTQSENRIAAAAKWYFYDDNPYDEHGEVLVADWYPEGVSREFATQAVRIFERPREEMARRGHACTPPILQSPLPYPTISTEPVSNCLIVLHIAFTLPSYRHRGLGRMFMDWGIRIADERGLEAWLDASEFGVPLYEKFGFRRVLVNKVRPVPERELTDREKAEWEECERVMLPIEYTVMWRPRRGDHPYEERKMVLPWEEGKRDGWCRVN
ncbi:uncharacterized protein DSM5745_05128 [Aspergillus mulundensis]|uniref:N-acetyltransferase domain-containing protein n=1 Tax=Aspergillus mulundensis TaxID=1810919 RepID=A0A3D8S676_9EURO|nr:Uncharacterized protein DSM5745_05128 [Aspergillus mulundensis]RDW81571.1 Uncharacterized protein DSM5745_05128 [Aspergillus mulundensis]